MQDTPEPSALDARAKPRSDAAFEAFERASHLRSLAIAMAQASRDCVKLVELDGRVAAINPAAETLLQLDDPLTIIGRQWADTWPEAGRESVRGAVRQGAEGRSTTFEGFCPTAKGEPRWWQVTVAPVRDEAGVVRCLLGSSRDITAQRDRERELNDALTRQRHAILSLAADFEAGARKLRDAEARVVHDDKLRLFGRFVGGVVHDFNNVFAAVHGAARLLRRRVTDPTTLDVVGHLERASERGALLSRQLLDFSRAEAEAAEVFAPAILLARDAHLLRHIVSADAELIVETDPEGWPVLGSPQKFQSVAFNLVANARDAIAAQGRIVVKLENCSVLQRPEGLDGADYVRLSVTDDGAGMPPDVLERVGEPFFTTKPAGKGSGLGLASAFELAALCGGRAFVDSREGEGTSVCVYMRRSAVEGEIVGTPDAPVDPALHGDAQILVVEDDALVRDYLCNAFRTLGYDVTEAASCEIATAMAAGRTFDLVIADVNLPDGLGDQLVTALRKAQPGLAAIYVTASSGLDIPRDETVLRKPVSETQLAQAVLEKLGRLAATAPEGALRKVEQIANRLRDPQMRRCLDEWGARAQASRRIPSVFDAGPWRGEAPPLGYIVAVGPGATPTLRFIRAGAALSARIGRELEGTELTRADEETLGDIPRALRRRLDGSPGYDYTRLALDDGENSTVERLLLPLSDHEGRVGHIFGLVAFHEQA